MPLVTYLAALRPDEEGVYLRMDTIDVTSFQGVGRLDVNDQVVRPEQISIPQLIGVSPSSTFLKKLNLMACGVHNVGSIGSQALAIQGLEGTFNELKAEASRRSTSGKIESNLGSINYAGTEVAKLRDFTNVQPFVITDGKGAHIWNTSFLATALLNNLGESEIARGIELPVRFTWITLTQSVSNDLHFIHGAPTTFSESRTTLPLIVSGDNGELIAQASITF